ncbi:hypothetical protein [Labrys monachus]|uniref:Cytochrome c556 n=1 Tax=Labrys monachus TaxID=217067 RepID=A0ABU0FCE3_9HYPH|nr:hypothetical protein [Labrys monachus]MDQ0392101.1 cytochrome c556 [Labrys monachus]
MQKHHGLLGKYRPYTIAGLAVLALTGPALALSLKGLMRQMSDNTSAAKAALSSFDARTAEAVLRRYAADAREGKTLFASGQSARDQDMRARFDRMAAAAEPPGRQTLDPASFRKAFVAVVTECKTCHSAHK